MGEGLEQTFYYKRTTSAYAQVVLSIMTVLGRLAIALHNKISEFR